MCLYLGLWRTLAHNNGTAVGNSDTGNADAWKREETEEVVAGKVGITESTMCYCRPTRKSASKGLEMKAMGFFGILWQTHSYGTCMFFLAR